MFDSVRKHQRLMLALILLLILPAFVFFGVSGYDQMIGGRDDVAVVAGTRIPRATLEEAHRRQVEQMRSMLGDQADVRMFDTPDAKARVLESLITQQALLADASQRHLAVSPAEIQKAVMAIAAFHGPDGKFSFEQYQMLLAQNQRTPRMFEGEIARELQMQAISTALQDSAFTPRSVVERVFVALESRRTLRVLTIDPKTLESGLAPTDAQLRGYYDQHADRYRLPETIDAEVLVLDRSKLAPAGKPSDDELRGYYEQNRSRYTTPETRRASHILITVDAGADAATREAARKKAEALLAEAKAHPDRFAELAKANSQDPGSAEQGGDLGFFERELMVKPFSDAAFAVQPGEFTPLVESEFGFHVIRVTDAKAGGVAPFESVREQLVTTWNEQQAARRYSELAEQFRNTVYEQPDSLEPAATRFGLTVQKVAGVGRAPAPGATGPLADARVLGQLFADDALRNHRNTEATEVQPGVLVSARVERHHPSRQQPFDEVKDTVRAQWTLDEAARLARERGEALLGELKGRDDAANAGEIARFEPPVTVTRTQPGRLAPQAVAAAFSTSADRLPAYAGVDLGRTGYQVVRIEKVEGPPADAESRRPRYVEQYDQTSGQSAASIWIQDVLARIPIERHRIP